MLLTAVLVSTALLARHSRPAAALMAPYAAWVAFATLLSSSTWWLDQ